MTSITSWVRIEPRSRGSDLLAGTEARLHDPLWLLARQWQLRELAGVDGGSSMFARAHLTTAKLDAVRAPGGTWANLDPNTPLDVALAPAASEPVARPPLAARARAGRQLMRMVTNAGASDFAKSLVTRFALAVSAAEAGLLDADDKRFLQVMTGRVPDGDLAATTLAPLLAAGDLPASYGVPTPQVATVSRACRDWLAWRAALVKTSGASTWRDDHVDYRFEVRASGQGTELVLSGAHEPLGPLRWYELSASSSPPVLPHPVPPTPGVPVQPRPAAPQPAPDKTIAAIPSRVRYTGMPARRYWDLEDGAVSWPSVDAGPGDVGRLMLVEVALTLADHWLMIPIELDGGSLAQVSSLIVTDTFGVRVRVRGAAELDGAQTPWRFCELTRPSSVAGPLLLVPPSASEAVFGRPLDAVDLARDDVSDVLWAIERTRLGADGRPRELPPPSSVPSGAPTGAPPLAYRLGPDVPHGYHPYIARTGTTGLELARASIPGTPPSDEPSTLPARLSIAAVPARPRQLQRVDSLLRAADGSYHVIRRRLVAPVVPRQGVTLQFDQLDDRSARP